MQLLGHRFPNVVSKSVTRIQLGVTQLGDNYSVAVLSHLVSGCRHQMMLLSAIRPPIRLLCLFINSLFLIQTAIQPGLYSVLHLVHS